MGRRTAVGGKGGGRREGRPPARRALAPRSRRSRGRRRGGHRRRRLRLVAPSRPRAARAGPRRPAHHHRHPARGRARLLRERERRDALDRPPGRGRRALRPGPRPERGHAALARQHPLRPVPARPRRPRQRGLPLPRRRRHPGHAPEARGLPHRRLRERVPARLALRPRPRVRRLRRPARRSGSAHRVPHAGAAGRADGGRGAALAGRPGHGADLHAGSTSTSRTSPTSRPSPSPRASRRRRTTARWPTRTALLGPLLEPLLARGQDGRTLVVLTGDHGEGLGEHGEKTHGIFAYETTLRVPADPLRARGSSAPRGGRGAACGTSTSCPRSSTRSASTPPDGLPGRSLLAARRRAAARAPAPSYFEALSSSAEPRLGAAHRPGPRPLQVHRPAAARALRPRRRPARDEEPRGHASRSASKRSARQLARMRAADRGLARGEESAETRERLRSLGYASARRARRRRATRRPTTPSG